VTRRDALSRGPSTVVSVFRSRVDKYPDPRASIHDLTEGAQLAALDPTPDGAWTDPEVYRSFGDGQTQHGYSWAQRGLRYELTLRLSIEIGVPRSRASATYRVFSRYAPGSALRHEP
jgi:hypothetical protein